MSLEKNDPAVEASPAGTARPFDVFLSYKSSDHEIVEKIAEGLAAQGLKTFLDRWDLEPGLRWRPELEQVLATCNAVAVCLGPEGAGGVQKLEVDVALGRQNKDPAFPVIPVLLPDGEKPTGFLGQLTWIDLQHTSVADGVKDLARAIRRNRTGSKGGDKTGGPRPRYLMNLCLLLGVILLVAAWYYRHLHSFAQVAVGGSITILAALARLLYGYVRWGAEAEVKDFSRRWLGHRRMAPVLGCCIGIAVALLALTSSIHLEAVPGAGPGYTVEVRTPDGRPLWTAARMGSDRTSASKLFFFRFGADPQLSLLNADDRLAVRARMRPWTRFEIRVPGGFPARQVSVFRLLPGAGLQFHLAFPGRPSSTTYDLAVVWNGETHRITDLRRQAVYVAVNSNDLAFAWDQESDGTRRERFEEYLRTWLPKREESVSGLLERWLESPRTEIWPEMPPLNEADFFLIKAGSGEPKAPVALNRIVVDVTNQVRTLLIGTQ